MNQKSRKNFKRRQSPPPERDRLSYKALFRAFKVFGNHYKDHWKKLVLAYSGMFFTILFGVLLPWPLKLILDYVILKNPLPEKAAFITAWFGANPYTLLGLLVGAFILLHVIDSFIAFFYKIAMLMVSTQMIRDIRLRVFSHMQRLSLSYRESFLAGDMVLRLISDLRNLPRVLIFAPQHVCQRVFTIATHAGLMLVLEWRLALVAFSVLPVMYYFNRRFSLRVQKASRKKRSTESNIASLVTENFSSMALIQAYGREDDQQARFNSENRESLALTLKATRFSKVYNRVTDVLMALGTGLVLYVGGGLALDNVILPGTLVLFATYLKKMYSPVDKFSGMLLDFATAQVAAERMLELIECKMVMEDAPHAVPAPPFKERLEFRNVSFSYKDGVNVLHDLNFTVAAGETVALVGHSGAGKSTVASLLLRFYDPQQGQVLLDGRDIRDCTLKSVRDQITLLMQEARLFNKTVRENIAFGKLDEASDDEVHHAARLAQAHDFIMQMPEAYGTMIARGGNNLSGGQKQRLNMARAIIRNTPIVILDEPSVALDAKAEAKTHEALAELTKDKTTFIIAHNFSTIAHADKILVLEGGRLVALGTHEQLLQTCEHYRELYAMQLTRPVAYTPPAPERKNDSFVDAAETFDGFALDKAAYS